METIAKILLVLHIAGGMVCLFAGTMAIMTKKGGKLHAISGKSYFIGMFTVIITAVVLSLFRENLFLLLIASFSFYMTWAGVRSIRNKSLKANILDWIFLGTAIVTAIFMILSFNIILLVLGSILAINVVQELILFIQARKKQLERTNKWLTRHIGMMLGSFIATTTAFLVTNVQDFNPSWLPWLAPTMVGTPLIIYFTRRTAKKGL